MSTRLLFTPGDGRYQDLVDAALQEMARDQVLARIWAIDNTVWKPDPKEITNRLDWLTIANAMGQDLATFQELVQAVQADGYTHALLLGMGGSSLAPEVFRLTFGVKEGYLDLAVLDSTDPGAVQAFADKLDMAKTLFIVSTKSGGTVETLSFFKFFYNKVLAAVGRETAGKHFIAITDPGSSLADLAAEYDFRATYLNNPNIGGRFSALSYFGLIPAALVGVDLPALLKSAQDAMAENGPDADPTRSPAAMLGVIMGELAKVGRDKVTLVTSPQIASFGDWSEQLIAESTGKEGKGILPVVGEPLGAPAAYKDDRLFVYLHLEGETSQEAALKALEQAGHPVVRISMSDLYDLGAQYFLWELATAVSGYRLQINPFDQPNVESAKKLARSMVKAYEETGKLPAMDPTLTEGAVTVFDTQPADNLRAAVNNLLSAATPGSYISLQAYVNPTPETMHALQELRLQLRAATGMAVTIGFGPRFLHSTGQLHKGDAGNGLFIQFTSDDPRDVPIPDKGGEEKSTMTFGVLIQSQAMGDRQALLDEGRRAVRFHLDGDVVGGINTVKAMV